MLQDANAVATLAVKDLGVAAKFYEDTLGLTRYRCRRQRGHRPGERRSPNECLSLPAFPARTRQPL